MKLLASNLFEFGGTTSSFKLEPSCGTLRRYVGCAAQQKALMTTWTFASQTLLRLLGFGIHIWIQTRGTRTLPMRHSMASKISDSNSQPPELRQEGTVATQDQNLRRKNWTGAVLLSCDQVVDMILLSLANGFRMCEQVTTISTHNSAPYFGHWTVLWKLCIQGRGTLQKGIAQGFERLVQCSWEYTSNWRLKLWVKTNFFGNVGPNYICFTTFFGAIREKTQRSTVHGWMRIGCGRLAKHSVWWIVLQPQKGSSNDGCWPCRCSCNTAWKPVTDPLEEKKTAEFLAFHPGCADARDCDRIPSNFFLE